MSKVRTPGSPVTKSVGDPSDSYLTLLPMWKKSRAILQGETYAKSHDEFVSFDGSNLLIPFSPTMSQAQFEFYKHEAELPGLTSQYCRVLISALLRKKSQLKLPDELGDEALEWIEKDFTLDGQSLFNFLDNVIWEELQTSRAWIFVDYPDVSDVELEAMSDVEKEKIKPYPTIATAESVINYQVKTHPVTKAKTLSRFVTRYLTETYEEDNPWHPTYVDTVADHYLDEAGLFVIDLYKLNSVASEVEVNNGTVTKDYKDKSSLAFEKYATILPQMFGKRISRIPAWPLNGQVEPIEPILMPLIDREVSLYNKVSRRNHLLYGAATYTPIVKSSMTDDEFNTLVSAGLGSWLRVREGEDITVLETPTAALTDMDRAITSTVDEMAKMGIRMLSPEQDSSGVALEIRNASQTAMLGTLNAKISGTMSEVIAFMLNWKYDKDYTGNDVDFELSSDFSPMVGGDAAMQLITNWYQSGIISRDTFVRIAKYNDYLPANYNDEEAVIAIQTDPLINNFNDDGVTVEE